MWIGKVRILIRQNSEYEVVGNKKKKKENMCKFAQKRHLNFFFFGESGGLDQLDYLVLFKLKTTMFSTNLVHNDIIWQWLWSLTVFPFHVGFCFIRIRWGTGTVTTTAGRDRRTWPPTGELTASTRTTPGRTSPERLPPPWLPHPSSSGATTPPTRLSSSTTPDRFGSRPITSDSLSSFSQIKLYWNSKTTKPKIRYKKKNRCQHPYLVFPLN